MKRHFLLSYSRVLLVCAACSNSPGRPGPHSEVIAPKRDRGLQSPLRARTARDVMVRRQGGAAISLGNPVFLAIADDARDSRRRLERGTWHADAGLRTKAPEECSPTNRSM